jgi:hypothetical protein
MQRTEYSLSSDGFSGPSQPLISAKKKKSPGNAGAFLMIDYFAFS